MRIVGDYDVDKYRFTPSAVWYDNKRLSRSQLARHINNAYFSMYRPDALRGFPLPSDLWYREIPIKFLIWRLKLYLHLL